LMTYLPLPEICSLSLHDALPIWEGAFKYFLLGSVASGFLLYGFALMYGATGTLSLAGLAEYAAAGAISPLYHGGFALAVVGFAFKLALVPFHMWAPDAYQAATPAVTAF